MKVVVQTLPSTVAFRWLWGESVILGGDRGDEGDGQDVAAEDHKAEAKELDAVFKEKGAGTKEKIKECSIKQMNRSRSWN